MFEITFGEKFRLVTRGIPIATHYELRTDEKSFRQMVEPKLASDGDWNPLSFSSARFTGRFHGYYGREFTIKPKSSYFRRDSITNSILIHGKVKSLDENRLSLTVIFHRTDFAKYGQWAQKAFYGLVILIMGSQMLMNSDYISFLTLGGALFFFYWFATLIAIGQAGGQIKYFERYFFEGVKLGENE